MLSIFRYLEPLMCDSRVWQTDRLCHSKCRTPLRCAAKNRTAELRRRS